MAFAHPLRTRDPRPCIRPIRRYDITTVPVPGQMKAWVLGMPDQILSAKEHTTVPRGATEFLVASTRSAICRTIWKSSLAGRGEIQAAHALQTDFTTGHEYRAPLALGPRRCNLKSENVSAWRSSRLRDNASVPKGMYTSCIQIWESRSGPRETVFKTDGGSRIRDQPYQNVARGRTRLRAAEAKIVAPRGLNVR